MHLLRPDTDSPQTRQRPKGIPQTLGNSKHDELQVNQPETTHNSHHSKDHYTSCTAVKLQYNMRVEVRIS